MSVELPILVFGGLVIVAMIAGFGLLVRMDYRHKQRMRELEKEEHLALAERGMAGHLEELARAAAEKSRYTAVGAVGVAVGLGVPGCATLATVFLGMTAGERAYIVAPLIVMWVMSGAAVLVSSILCMRALRPVPSKPIPAAFPPSEAVVGIQQKPISS